MCFYGFIIIALNSLPISTDKAEFSLKTDKLPANLSFMPTLGNGHLGYTVYGDSIFMNGIYNGEGGNSRRARIPNWINITATSFHGPEGKVFIRPDNYEMELDAGFFRWRHKNTAAGLWSEERTYAHRYYNRALIYELLVQRTVATETLYLKLRRNAFLKSQDFVFTPITTAADKFTVLRGRTHSVEHPHFQPAPKTVFIVISDNWNDEKILEWPAGQKELYYRFVFTADEEEAVARQEMETVLSLTPKQLLQTHIDEWQRFWAEFRIEVVGDLELSQVINAGLFYLASSLPSSNSSHVNNVYFGLSPTGLGRGHSDLDYQGHNFWDTEIWMLPIVTQLSTQWAEDLLQYRLRNLEAARYNAVLAGYRGAKFPWESAYTGTEVVQPSFAVIGEQEIHISPDIIFALQQHYATTHDHKWLCAVAWPLAQEVAYFLEKRVEFSTETQKYHIKSVIGPDEDHRNVTDNVYTNVVCKIALEFSVFLHQQCAPNAAINSTAWLDIAQRLHILYDALLDYHPQHMRYTFGESVKQADVILLGYPLQFEMNASTHLNDLNSYESVTCASGPAMTWSMFAINFLDAGEVEKADYYFGLSYKDYVHPEFKVWSETKSKNLDATNFLTGVGGFLQAIMNGFSGIRFRRIGRTSIMEIRKRHLLPTSEAINIKGIKFGQAKFALHIKSSSSAILTCLEMGKLDLKLSKGTEQHNIFEGFTINLGIEKAIIQTS